MTSIAPNHFAGIVPWRFLHASAAAFKREDVDSTPLEDAVVPLQLSRAKAIAAREIGHVRERDSQAQANQKKRKIGACVVCGTQWSRQWYVNGTSCQRCYNVARKVQRLEEEIRQGTICPKGRECRSLIKGRRITEWKTDPTTRLSTCSSCYYYGRRQKAASGKDIEAAPTKRIRHLPAAPNPYLQPIDMSRLQLILPVNKSGQNIKAAPTKRIRHLPRAIERSRLQPILPANDPAVAESAPLIGPIRPLTINDFV